MLLLDTLYQHVLADTFPSEVGQRRNGCLSIDQDCADTTIPVIIAMTPCQSMQRQILS